MTQPAELNLPALASAIARASRLALRYERYEEEVRNQWSARLTHADGRAVWMNTTRAKGRLHIDGLWPDDPRGTCAFLPRDILPRDEMPNQNRQHDFSITVSLTKTPEKIAADIARRFWPEYSRVFALMVTRAREIREEIDTRQQEAERLVAKLGGSISQNGNGEGVTLYLPGIYRATSYDGKSWRLDHVQLTSSQLEQLVGILQ
ncbi:MAG: hypothetical protein OEO20_11375 [Gemmatimonadota bacterium]|nr:hypothetical protein [Gemmatimonadota bacterium]